MPPPPLKLAPPPPPRMPPPPPLPPLPPPPRLWPKALGPLRAGNNRAKTAKIFVRVILLPDAVRDTRAEMEDSIFIQQKISPLGAFVNDTDSHQASLFCSFYFQFFASSKAGEMTRSPRPVDGTDLRRTSLRWACRSAHAVQHFAISAWSSLHPQPIVETAMVVRPCRDFRIRVHPCHPRFKRNSCGG